MKRNTITKAIILDNIKRRNDNRNTRYNDDYNQYDRQDYNRYNKREYDNHEYRRMYHDDDPYIYSKRKIGYGDRYSDYDDYDYDYDYDKHYNRNMNTQYHNHKTNEYEPQHYNKYDNVYQLNKSNSSHSKIMPLTNKEAIEWVRNMKNADGSIGELITMEQAKEWLTKKGYTGINLCDFYAMINAMKSDYSNVAKTFNITNDDFYGELARAFIMDKDAKPYKTSLYKEYIVM